MSRGFLPFSNGSQHADWINRNCAECVRRVEGECDINMALRDMFITGDAISHEIAERMGYLDNSPPRAKGWSLTWKCPEQKLEATDE